MEKKYTVTIVASLILVPILLWLFYSQNDSQSRSNIICEKSHSGKGVDTTNKGGTKVSQVNLSVNGHEMIVTLAKTKAADKLIERLQVQSLTLKLNEYGSFEKVGDLNFSLPSSDRQMKTSPGDIVLYQGNEISIFYGSNSWSYTPLGKIDNVSTNKLKKILGTSNVIVRFSIAH